MSLSMQAPHFQSPIIIYPQDIMAIPVEAMHVLAAEFENGQALADAAGKYADGTTDALSEDALKALVEVVPFVLRTLPVKETREATDHLAEAIGNIPDSLRVLVAPKAIKALDAELVAAMTSGMPQRPLSVKPAEHGTSGIAVLDTLAVRGHDNADAASFGDYIRHMLAEPDRDGHREALAVLLPRLLEQVAVQAVEPDSIASRILAAAAASIPAERQNLLVDPELQKLTITGHHAGTGRLIDKEFIASDYGQATGLSLVINADGADANLPDIVAGGIPYKGHHTHWHLGGVEHHVDGSELDCTGEVHIVHASMDGHNRFLVVGMDFRVDEQAAPNEMVEHLLDSSLLENDQVSHLDFLPQNVWEEGRFLRYRGGLTTEPYNEDVEFYLLDGEQVAIPRAQYDRLLEQMAVHKCEHDACKHNVRSRQPYLDRAVTETSAVFEREGAAIS
jgi:carbonic anhydrase